MNANAERVKDAIDIVSYIQSFVNLKKEGRLHVGLCPFHSEKSGSFKVNPETQRWQCFGACGEGGDVIAFAEKYHHLEFGDALEELARFAGITLEPLSPEMKQKQDDRARLYQLLMTSANFYQSCLFAHAPALTYLTDTRKLGEEVIDVWHLGYAPNEWQALYHHLLGKGYTDKEMLAAGVCAESDKSKRLYDFFRGRIMIPIYDHKRRVVGFSARAFDEGVTPKYLNSAKSDLFDKSRVIHGMPLFDTKSGLDAFKTYIAVEGSIDPISASNRGIFNVVSLMGKACSEAQIDMLLKAGCERLIFCLDQDNAGRTALRDLTGKYVSKLAEKGIELYAMFSPHGKDPDDAFREMPHLWQPAVENARPVLHALIDIELSALGDNPSAVKVSNMARELLPIIKNDNPFINEENFKILSSRTGIAVDELKAWAARLPYVMDKPLPAIVPAITNASSLPTAEEWVLHGILVNEDEDWLTRANNRLLIASVDNLAYALGPLTGADFTEPHTRRLMDLILKGQDVATLANAGKLETALIPTYERLCRLEKIGQDYNIAFDFNVFVGRVYSLRLKRLRQERPTYEAKEPAKARECAIAIACLMLATEDLLEA